MSEDQISTTEEPNLSVTTLVYILQAVGFFFVITFIVAIVINYVKLDEVKGSWLASHFKWQIRTFWFGAIWLALGFVTMPFVIGIFILFANAVWVIYRITKGWLYLNDKKAMYL